ncbi:SDR family NAD(P)-dependent oxidoreductase [Leptospira ilyithenensis]|uniref:SDR family NAD(P)-dependent oxidoreductase n=1 Tax=Leptospira ilyithenensis TaxID=2484901 RepID=A0A4R9LTZ9_9LEPT|nr:SDR family NAD(P)-dependent oxidoreductase [Leptospira ilyithenensis]TGN10889.1 SDR family NAD(P)-dependent oxidoreductase [Leptospira ilyithenensis]
MKLESKKVVITGASSGIGKEILSLLLAEGALVVVGDLNPETISDHPNLRKYKIDVSKTSDIDRLLEESIEILDKIDVFIANAGFAYYEKIQKEDWSRIKNIFSVNVFAPIYTIQKLINLQPKGVHIIITASGMAHLPLPGYALYSATKSAVHSFAEAFRYEMNKNFKLTVVYPIATKTKFFEQAGNSVPIPWPAQEPSQVAKKIVKVILRPRRTVYPSFRFKCLLVLNRFFPFLFPIYRLWQNILFQKWQKRKES